MAGQSWAERAKAAAKLEQPKPVIVPQSPAPAHGAGESPANASDNWRKPTPATAAVTAKSNGVAKSAEGPSSLATPAEPSSSTSSASASAPSSTDPASSPATTNGEASASIDAAAPVKPKAPPINVWAKRAEQMKAAAEAAAAAPKAQAPVATSSAPVPPTPVNGSKKSSSSSPLKSRPSAKSAPNGEPSSPPSTSSNRNRSSPAVSPTSTIKPALPASPPPATAATITTLKKDPSLPAKPTSATGSNLPPMAANGKMAKSPSISHASLPSTPAPAPSTNATNNHVPPNQFGSLRGRGNGRGRGRGGMRGGSHPNNAGVHNFAPPPPPHHHQPYPQQQQQYPQYEAYGAGHAYGGGEQFALDPTRYWLLGQIEFYFSIDNLCRDIFLRSKMDDQGWIDSNIIASFNRIKVLANDPLLVRSTMTLTPLLEVHEQHVRLRQGWQAWVLPNATPSTVRVGGEGKEGEAASKSGATSTVGHSSDEEEGEGTSLATTVSQAGEEEQQGKSTEEVASSQGETTTVQASA